MRRLQALLALVVLATTLVGCTGTSETLPPLLLAIGRQDPTNASAYQMVLVEDAFPNQPRLVEVAGSAVALPYPAVASDVVARAGARSSLVVLTRDLAPGTAPASALVRLNLSGIDPAAPTAFTAGPPLQLTAGTGPAFDAATYGDLCFSHISVSADGRYVYLIDDPNACAATPSPSAVVRLFQLDTSSLLVTQIASSSQVQPTAPYDDQASTKEGLYFLVSGTTDAQLYRVPVPYLPSQDIPTWVNNDAVFPGQDQIALSGNGTDLLAFTNSRPYGPPVDVPSSLEYLALPAKGSNPTVATIDGVRSFAADPSGFNPRILVAGFNQTAVHTSPTDSKPIATPGSYNLTGVGTAIDPLNNFGYVVGNGRIVLIDLLSPQDYTVSSTGPAPIPTSDLTLPTDAAGRYLTAVAWTRATLP